MGEVAGMDKMDKYIKKKRLGYNGCRNCKYQIEPLRTCEWNERGGDGVVHLICPRWEKRDGGDHDAD